MLPEIAPHQIPTTSERRASLLLTRDRLLAVALGVVSSGPRLQLRVTVWAVRESLHGRRTSSMQAECRFPDADRSWVRSH
jgi:hypothetical protein